MSIWSDNAASFRSLARQLREQAARETDRDVIARLLDHADWYDERAQIHQECHDTLMDEEPDDYDEPDHHDDFSSPAQISGRG